MKLITRINRIFNTFHRLTIWKKALVLLAVAFIIFTVYRESLPKIEGFEQREVCLKKETKYMTIFIRQYVMFCLQIR